MTMRSHDAEVLGELARLCSEARANLPESGFHRLRVLLDIMLIELESEGFASLGAAEPERATETEPSSTSEPA